VLLHHRLEQLTRVQSLSDSTEVLPPTAQLDSIFIMPVGHVVLPIVEI
jgi:hypothetical protein